VSVNRRRPPDPERIAAAIVEAHVKAFDVALQSMRPHLVAIIKRAISEAQRDGDDTRHPPGSVVTNLFDN
jgi:hypothetical protein